MSKEIGNDLIVDFGNRCRLKELEAQAMTETKKQVRFSEGADIHCFQYPAKEEISKRWISKKEKEFLTLTMIRDVGSIRHVLSTIPMEDLDKETLYGCVGLEALITTKVMNFLKAKKRLHARSIVEMQDQDHFGCEDLAAYAMKSSFESRERAHQLAAGYAEILPPIDEA